MYNRILTALSTNDADVFETALSVAMATDANLLLFHALAEHGGDSPLSPIPVAWDYETPLSIDAWKNYQKQWQAYEERGLALLHSYTERAEAAGVIADHLQTTNSPGIAICQTAKTWNADLIVMGSHQRRGIQELMLGSVSNYVMHHAPCSVMIVALDTQPETEQAVVRQQQYQAA